MTETYGSKTSAFPDAIPTFTAQDESGDPPSEDPEIAEAGEFNHVLAELVAMAKALGLGRGFITIDPAGPTATCAALKGINPATQALFTYAGGSVALTAATTNYIYLLLSGPTLTKSTSGFPTASSSPYIPLAIWSGTGSAYTDARPQLVANASSVPVSHAHSGAEITSGDIAIARLATALLLSAKGDLLSRDGSGFARLAVGSNTHVLEADSSATEGIKWAAMTLAKALAGGYEPAAAGDPLGSSSKPFGAVYSREVQSDGSLLLTLTGGSAFLKCVRGSDGFSIVPYSGVDGWALIRPSSGSGSAMTFAGTQIFDNSSRTALFGAGGGGGIDFGSARVITWGDSDAYNATRDLSIYRAAAGVLGVGAGTAGGAGAIQLGQGSEPTPAADSACFYVADDSGTAKAYVTDEAGNETLLSAHASDYPPGMVPDDDPWPQVGFEFQRYLGLIRWKYRGSERIETLDDYRARGGTRALRLHDWDADQEVRRAWAEARQVEWDADKAAYDQEHAAIAERITERHRADVATAVEAELLEAEASSMGRDLVTKERLEAETAARLEARASAIQAEIEARQARVEPMPERPADFKPKPMPAWLATRVKR